MMTLKQLAVLAVIGVGVGLAKRKVRSTAKAVADGDVKTTGAPATVAAPPPPAVAKEKATSGESKVKVGVLRTAIFALAFALAFGLHNKISPFIEQAGFGPLDQRRQDANPVDFRKWLVILDLPPKVGAKPTPASTFQKLLHTLRANRARHRKPPRVITVDIDLSPGPSGFIDSNVAASLHWLDQIHNEFGCTIICGNDRRILEPVGNQWGGLKVSIRAGSMRAGANGKDYPLVHDFHGRKIDSLAMVTAKASGFPYFDSGFYREEAADAQHLAPGVKVDKEIYIPSSAKTKALEVPKLNVLSEGESIVKDDDAAFLADRIVFVGYTADAPPVQDDVFPMERDDLDGSSPKWKRGIYVHIAALAQIFHPLKRQPEGIVFPLDVALIAFFVFGKHKVKWNVKGVALFPTLLPVGVAILLLAVAAIAAARGLVLDAAYSIVASLAIDALFITPLERTFLKEND